MMVEESSFFVTGGTLRHDAPSYVERDADTDLYEGLKRGEFCYVLTSRQMGKSSLMNRTAARLREEGVAVATLDLAMLGQNLTVEQWYYGLLSHIGQQLDLSDELRSFWRNHQLLGPFQRWMAAIQEVILPVLGVRDSDPTPIPSVPNAQRLTPNAQRRLVIFIDEIDAIRSLPFSTDELFAGIRECYNRRTADPEFACLTFCLLGVTTPTHLIQDPRTTPFNIGRRIELTDFTAAEAAPLALGLERWALGVGPWALGLGETDATAGRPSSPDTQGPTPNTQRLLERILYWTGGHPYLTQLLCRSVADTNAANPKCQTQNPKSIDQLCEELFFCPRAQERDDNLVFVQERMLRSEVGYLPEEEMLASLLDLYAQVCRGRRVRDDDTNPLIGVLRLSGIARVAKGDVQVRNRIYGRVFDLGWVAQHMPDAEVRRQRAAFRHGLLRASALAAVILAVVGWLALTANYQARRAEQFARRESEQRRNGEWLLYAADMHLAQQALDEGDLRQAKELLDVHRPGPGGEDLRGFEWRYLWQLCQSQEWKTLPGPRAEVFSVAFSPNGKTLAAAAFDGMVKLWDVATAREVAALRQDPNHSPPARVAFSPDGKTLAVGCHDFSVRLWDVAARRQLAHLEGHKDQVWSVAFSPDGKTLATKSKDNTLKLWNVARRREIRTLQGPHAGRVEGLAFSPDGKKLAWGARGKTIKLRDLATKGDVASLQGHDGDVYCVAFSPDGKTLASGSLDTTIKLWDIASRREMATLLGHRGRVSSVAFSPDGKRLVSSSLDNTVRLWDVARKKEVATLRGHLDAVNSAQFSPDGKILASGSNDKTVKLWKVATRQEVDVLLGGPEGRFRASPMVFSPNGKTLALGSVDGTVSLWDVATRQEVGTLHGHALEVYCVAFSPDGKTLASSSEDTTVRLWDIASRHKLAVLKAHTKKVWSVAFSPDGKILASGGRDAIKLWDVASWREMATLEKLKDVYPHWTAFSPDGKTLAEGCVPNMVTLWDVSSRRYVGRLVGDGMGFTVVAFAPDGQTLASGSWDKIVRLWDVARQQEVKTLKGHRSEVETLAFSPDGQTLASGSQDNTVKLWNMTIKQEVATLKGHQTEVGAVTFSPDGRTLASRSIDGVIRFWRAPTFAEIEAHEHASQPRASR